MKNQMFALLQTLRARARTRKPRPTSLRANKRSQKEAKKAAVMAMKLNNGDISIHNNQVKDDVFCSFLPKKKANIASFFYKVGMRKYWGLLPFLKRPLFCESNY